MDLSPFCGASAVGAHTVEVDGEENGSSEDDVTLGLEVGEAVALVNFVPLGVCESIGLSHLCSGRSVGRSVDESSGWVVCGDGSGLLSSKVGEVCRILALQLPVAC